MTAATIKSQSVANIVLNLDKLNEAQLGNVDGFIRACVFCNMLDAKKAENPS